MLALLLSSIAWAESLPVVVRFDAAGAPVAEPLVVVLTSTGPVSEAALRDDGERPDFAKGDGRFAGVARSDGADITVELTAAGVSLGKATATFTDPTTPHDLDLSLTGGVAPPSAANQPAVTFPTGGSSDGLLFIGFGVGLLALLGAAWLWRRSQSGPAHRSAEVQVVPEPGLFAPTFPSLSDGLAVWATGDQAGAVLQPLLTTLADRHRVLVAAPAEVTVAPVPGGPVYRVVGTRPSLVGDVADSLAAEAGPPLCVLLVLERTEGEALLDYRDLLPSGVGGVVLVAEAAESTLPTCSLRAAEGGWSLAHGDAEVRLVAGRRGLEPA